jgi:hypothetical protein
MSGYIRRSKRFAYQPYLRELMAHWDGSFEAQPSFEIENKEEAQAFYQAYQRALGGISQDPAITSYSARFNPTRQMIRIFASGYECLRQGDPIKAGEHFRDLARLTRSRMADAWIWLSATVDDEQLRMQYLRNALKSDPTHPLASDAVEILKGEVEPSILVERDDIVLTQCPKCGGALKYEPGAPLVECAYCGRSIDLNQVDLIDGPAASLRQLRLGRLIEVSPWQEAQRILGCQACGAELTMTKHIARRCNFCGSTNVVVEDSQRQLQQPDGVMPFSINQDQAEAAIKNLQQPGWDGFQVWSRAWFGQGQTFLPLASPSESLATWRPWRRARNSKIGPLLGFYLPFWVFDSTVGVAYNAGRAVHARNRFENIVYPGVSTLDSLTLEGIQPYDMSALVPYKPKLIADWPAQLYDSEVENVAEEAYSVMIELARREMGDSGQRYQISDSTYQLILLPVWAALLGRKDEPVLALVNGQTGKVAFGPLQ